MIKLVAFDLDGTIGDTIPMCLKALKKAVTPYVTYNHFKAVNIITDAVRLLDILLRISLAQFLILIDCPYRLADVARENPEQVGYLELCHPYRCFRHSDYTCFIDCYYSSVHNQRLFDRTLFTFIISLRMEESNTRA